MWSLFAARKIEGSQRSEMCVLDFLKTCSLKNVSAWKWANTLGVLQLEEFYFDEQTKTQGEQKKKDSDPSLWVIHQLLQLPFIYFCRHMCECKHFIWNGLANVPALTYIVMENNFHLTVICFIFSCLVAMETQTDVAGTPHRSQVMDCLSNGPLLITLQPALEEPGLFARDTLFR